MRLDLTGKTALMTEEANGLCFEIAKAYYAAGTELYIIDIAPNIAEAAASIQTDRKVKFYSCNLADLEHLSIDYQKIKKLCGKIDILLYRPAPHESMDSAASMCQKW